MNRKTKEQIEETSTMGSGAVEGGGEPKVQPIEMDKDDFENNHYFRTKTSQTNF